MKRTRTTKIARKNEYKYSTPNGTAFISPDEGEVLFMPGRYTVEDLRAIMQRLGPPNEAAVEVDQK